MKASFNETFFLQAESATRGSESYNQVSVLFLSRSPCLDRLQRAWLMVCERHELLRSSYRFSQGKGRYEREVIPGNSFTIVDKRARPLISAMREVKRLTREGNALHQRQSQLFAVQTKGGGLFVVLRLSHVISDDWTQTEVIKCLVAGYFSELRVLGFKPLSFLKRFTAETRTYSDYVEWMDNYISSENGARARSFVDAENALPATINSMASITAAASGGRSANFKYSLSGDEQRRIAKLTAIFACTEFELLAAVYLIHSYKFNGHNSCRAAITFSSRPISDGFSSTVGCFVNKIGINAHTEVASSIGKAIRDNIERVKTYKQYRFFPFAAVDEAAEEAQFNFNYIRNKRFSKMRTALLGEKTIRLPALSLRYINAEKWLHVNGLHMTYMSMPDGSYIDITSGLDSDQRWFAANYCRSFMRFLDEIHAELVSVDPKEGNPVARFESRPTGAIAITSGHDECKLEHLRQAARHESEDVLCVHEMVARHRRQFPNDVAIMFGPMVYTYAALDSIANGIAHELLGAGVPGNGFVLAVFERGADMIFAALGALKAGLAYIPIPGDTPLERIKTIHSSSGARLALVSSKTRSLVAQVGADLHMIDVNTSARSSDVCVSLPTADRQAPAYCIYTSGTTGAPKGVSVNHDSLANLIAWHRRMYPLPREARVGQLGSYGFDLCIWDTWGTLCSGATLVIGDEHTSHTIERLLPWLQRFEITQAFLPPVLLKMLFERPDVNRELPAFKFALTGADRLDQYPPPGLGFRVFNNYGPTECTAVACATEVPPKQNDTRGFPAIGRPVDNTELHVLDNQFCEVPFGIAGELFISGRCLGQGYLNDRQLTEAQYVFRKLAGDVAPRRLYRTGDMARRLEDGTVDFLGRIDDQISLRGYRIHLSEIEAAIRDIDFVADVVVCTKRMGGGEELIACCVMKAEIGAAAADEPTCAAITGTHIKVILHKKLPRYMIPAQYLEFTHFPLNSNKKIDRKMVRSMAVDWFDVHVYRAPIGLIEIMVAGYFAEILKVGRVGRDDDFFQLGGNSLGVVDFVDRVERACEISIPVYAFFQLSTVKLVAQYIGMAAKAKPDSTEFSIETVTLVTH